MNLLDIAPCTILETNVAISNADHAYVAANLKRVALFFPSNSNGAMTYSTAGTAVVNQGIVVPVGSAGLWIDICTHGAYVTAAWRGICAAVNAAGVNSLELLRP